MDQTPQAFSRPRGAQSSLAVRVLKRLLLAEGPAGSPSQGGNKALPMQGTVAFSKRWGGMHLKQQHCWQYHRWAAFQVWQRWAWRGDRKWYLGPKLELWDKAWGGEFHLLWGLPLGKNE